MPSTASPSRARASSDTLQAGAAPVEPGPQVGAEAARARPRHDVRQSVRGGLGFAKGGAIHSGLPVPFAHGGVIQARSHSRWRAVAWALPASAAPRRSCRWRADRTDGSALPPRGGGGGINVTFNVSTPDADSFRRSETQVAAMLTRAVSLGQRNLSGMRRSSSRPLPLQSGWHHELPRDPFPDRHLARRARRPRTAHGRRRARLRLRGTQQPLGGLAPQLQRRLRRQVARRAARRHRLLRGAARTLSTASAGAITPTGNPAPGEQTPPPRSGHRHRRRHALGFPVARSLRQRACALDAHDRQAGHRHGEDRGRRRRASRSARTSPSMRRPASCSSCPALRRRTAPSSPPASSSTFRCASTPTGWRSTSPASSTAPFHAFPSSRCAYEELCHRT